MSKLPGLKSKSNNDVMAKEYQKRTFPNMAGARSRTLVKLAFSSSIGELSEYQASSVSQPSSSQGDSSKLVVEVTGAQVLSTASKPVVEQQNIRGRELLAPSSEPTASIGAITPSIECHDVMECRTQIHPVEKLDEVMQEQSDTDFSSGSDEFYAPFESETHTDVTADDVTNIHSVADIPTIQQPQSMSDTDQNIIIDQEQQKPRKHKGQVNRNEWKRLKNAKLRLEGKSYVGFEKQENGKYKQTKIKESRCLGSRCKGHPQPKKGKEGPRQDFKCNTIEYVGAYTSDQQGFIDGRCDTLPRPAAWILANIGSFKISGADNVPILPLTQAGDDPTLESFLSGGYQNICRYVQAHGPGQPPVPEPDVEAVRTATQFLLLMVFGGNNRFNANTTAF
ncbi:unnamed protein product [Diabrotica balteata]|uniref:Uncharacterized protein n=1 Tax=Diabrotica balteata TaxID=107213 RepID=A0A9N9T856_DIABA|nr:unnamed protein product [Diabrotica balteata]